MDSKRAENIWRGENGSTKVFNCIEMAYFSIFGGFALFHSLCFFFSSANVSFYPINRKAALSPLGWTGQVLWSLKWYHQATLPEILGRNSLFCDRDARFRESGRKERRVSASVPDEVSKKQQHREVVLIGKGWAWFRDLYLGSRKILRDLPSFWYIYA